MVGDNIRATDSDCNGTCQALEAALDDGRLSTEEHRERVSTATKAPTLSELGSLLTDLQMRPDAPPTPPARLINRRGAR
ncbi:DUF1707 domain-containing protein [Mycobacterium szulgai]|nr:DUF1707 domain-containing protein [Mycobacterium szulgai]